MDRTRTSRPPGFITVETDHGTLRGLASARVTSFLGVPYAAPVSGAGRFTGPRPVADWVGVRDALSFGAASPQSDPRLTANAQYYEVLRLLYPGVPSPLEGRPAAEDSLFLNVWTPAADGARRPVMVWLHGGGFVHGTGAEGWFQGDRLAVEGDVVVVTLNHRLGALGFLGGVDGSAGADSGVAGMLDIVAALGWVRDNIALFGGDPGNVTVFGQSGGGGKVATLMAMPAARGLFHKAIIQSGPFGEAVLPDAAARTRRALERELERLGASLGDAPVAAILEAQDAVIRAHGMMAFAPVLHETQLPKHPFVHAAPEQAAGIPLLIGSTTHEFALMLSENAWYHSLEASELPGRFREFFPDESRAAFERYRELEPGPVPQLVLARAASDALFGAPTDSLRDLKARQDAPVYAYRFDYRTEVLGGILGAHHSLDLPFVFGNTDRSPVTGTAPERAAVSADMLAAWASFARTGVPANERRGPWPSVGVSGQQVVFGLEPRLEDARSRPVLTSTLALAGESS